MANELHEKCAVVAVALDESNDWAPAAAFEALFALQHRGTEASGLAYSNSDDQLIAIREKGMVKDVYTPERMHGAVGNLAIGHNRYATSGTKDVCNQPLIDCDIGFAMAHNGTFPVTDDLEKYLLSRKLRIHNRIDSELAGMAIAQHIREGEDLVSAITETYPLLQGGATIVGMHDQTVFAFREHHGIRPGVIGSLDEGWVVASETCGLDMLGAQYERDVSPGELICITNNQLTSHTLASADGKFDAFEIVYFMRPDSIVNGESVHEKRYRAGVELAKLHSNLPGNRASQLVIPVPDTSVPAAEGYAHSLDLAISTSAITKNRYIGRTFMEGTPKDRQQAHRRKHNLIPGIAKGHDVIFVDDSIVRLTTMPSLTRMALAAGARTVSVLIASPPVRFPDFYGIDTPTQKELAAANLTVEDMRKEIGCDYLGFITLSGLVRSFNIPSTLLNLSCFNGEYPIDIGREYNNIEAPVSMEYAD